MFLQPCRMEWKVECVQPNYAADSYPSYQPGNRDYNREYIRQQYRGPRCQLVRKYVCN